MITLSFIFTYIYIYLHIFIYIYLHIYILYFLHVHIFRSLYVSNFLYLYINIFIYTHTHCVAIQYISMSIFENIIFQVSQTLRSSLDISRKHFEGKQRSSTSWCVNPMLISRNCLERATLLHHNQRFQASLGGPGSAGHGEGRLFFFSYFWQTKEGPCGYEWTFCCMKVAEHIYRLMSNLGFVCQSSLTGRTVSKKE